VHTSYNIAGTTSGRLSSSDPNCQNIPRDKTIKHLFCAKDGYSLVQCDLSAAEFRAWGHYSQDQKMITDIKSNFDIHRYTASKVFNLPEDKITKEQRTAAKRVVFGLMYGQGVEATAIQNGLGITQARKVIETFFGRYTRAKAWLECVVVQAKQTKHLTNIFGRKRRFLGFDSPNTEARALCERQAKNFLMQSTVADITNWAGVRLFKILRQYDSYLVLTVHDSLVYEVPDCHVDKVKDIIYKEITKPIKGYTVPIGIELKVGKHWDD
jgi:DNA polymerase-1